MIASETRDPCNHFLVLMFQVNMVRQHFQIFNHFSKATNPTNIPILGTLFSPPNAPIQIFYQFYHTILNKPILPSLPIYQFSQPYNLHRLIQPIFCNQFSKFTNSPILSWSEITYSRSWNEFPFILVKSSFTLSLYFTYHINSRK